MVVVSERVVGHLVNSLIEERRTIAHEVIHESWGAGHNDWMHRGTSNYGQHFVAQPRVVSAAYDGQWGDHICWLSKSPWDGGTEKHRDYDIRAGVRAQLIAASPNLGRALLELEPLLDLLIEAAAEHHDNPSSLVDSARAALKKAGLI